MGKSTPQNLVSEARRLRAQEDWGNEAIIANTNILDLDPTNVAALNRRARCYWEQKNLIAAEKDYRRALGLCPGNKHIEKALQEIREKAREEREHEEQVDKVRAISNFAQACAIGRDYKNKPPAKRQIAIEAFRQAFRLNNDNTDVLIELAAIHRSLRQRDEAERIYAWILRRERNSAAKVGLAAIYKDRKRLRDGLRLCDEVLADEPHNPYALRCRAGILSELDRGAEAVESFGKSFGQR